MNTSLNWIKAMVPGLECTDQEFRDAMTLSGTKVECFNAFDKNLDKIVVGQILSVERHPDADKLVICQVNVGSENVQIVTGAPNIEVGSSVQRQTRIFHAHHERYEVMTAAHFQKTELRLRRAS